jgi:single-stranded-DNA-specific exonuclease
LQQCVIPKFEWETQEPDKEIVQELSQNLQLPDFIAAVLVQRGLNDSETAREFLNPHLDNLHDPFLLDDMDHAVERIRQALLTQEKVLICGDYDVDGITSVALLKRALPNSGIDVFTYLPNRLSEGYGFHEHSVAYAREIGATLMITVDCGITSRETVLYAKRYGIDTIITDHHEQNGPLPEAVAVINPKRENSGYPDENLAGIGVAFKLVSALMQKGMLRFPMPSILELVALGTVADVAKLIGENRILVYHGLQALTHTSHSGLKALKKVCHIVHGRNMDPYMIGYQLGPRINAVGRLGTPECALDLLLVHSAREADVIARNMDHVNHQRQGIEEKILENIRNKVEQMDLDAEPFIVLDGEDWHEGVIGIVASKITDRYFRPTCIISINNGVGKGSGRSIPSFNLFDCLSRVSEHLIEFGGHKIAAGFRIKPEKISDFRAACIHIAKDMIRPADLIPSITIDSLIDLDDINFSSIRALNRIAPFGLGNPKPKFLLRGLHNHYSPRVVGADGNHLKLTVAQGNRTISAIAFGFGRFAGDIESAESMDIVATPEINRWNQREILQLHIHDIRITP